MLVVKIEICPKGSLYGAREIGRMYIANTGEGTPDRGDYQVAVCRKGSKDVPRFLAAGPRAARYGDVRDYPRKGYNVWRLVSRALRSAFPEER
jgi:hypothetical protein